MLGALGDLGVALQAVALGLAAAAPPSVPSTGCPAAVSVPARFRVDRHVQRSGDSGSPRDSGSTSASSAGTSPGSVSASFLRPPPGARTRGSGLPWCLPHAARHRVRVHARSPPPPP